jgi:hypothetical protein
MPIGHLQLSMSALELIQINLFSPVILCFFLGIIATLVKSDLRFPEPLYQALSIYLLLAIGMKGGFAIRASTESGILLALVAGMILSAAIPLWAYPILRFMGRFTKADAAAVAAHYGSVSVVTFLAATTFLSAIGVHYEGFFPALVAVMEIPGIIVALLLIGRSREEPTPWLDSFYTVLSGKSVFLLIGGLAVGYVSGEQGMIKVEPFLIAPFHGILCLFLLEMGMLASRRFSDLKRVGKFIIAFGVLMPIANAVIGILVGSLIGLSQGGAFILGTLASSASYIAAPATIRLAVPEASPALYLTSSLAITFPFNLTIGIPLYFTIARWLIPV